MGNAHLSSDQRGRWVKFRLRTERPLHWFSCRFLGPGARIGGAVIGFGTSAIVRIRTSNLLRMRSQPTKPLKRIYEGWGPLYVDLHLGVCI